MKKDKCIEIICSAAKYYKENLLNKNFLFIYRIQNKMIDNIEIVFHKRNFLHLTGVSLNTKMSANYFFDTCINGKLSETDFELLNEKSTILKLSILANVLDLSSYSMIGDHNGHSIGLYSEKLAGGVFGCMGFVTSQDSKNFYVPNTVLNVDIRSIVGKTYQIIAIFSKNKLDSSYKKIVKCAANVDVHEIIKSANIDFSGDV